MNMRQVILAGLLAGIPSAGQSQGFSPEESLQRMQVPDGFEVSLVAAEPLVRQPVAIDFDDRGRLWVIQYLQYPNPAGLKRVKVDQYTRTKYDRVPEPPPNGPEGADRISILEDSDGDGQMDRAKDFINGLNLASGFAFGHGGVFVMQAPYLLFYPDTDRDDVPDRDPDVLLRGFGMDDASSVANSLTFGPDGWLYGCQGSTVTAVVRDIKFVQAIWRYHPVTKEFELFAEGGGNMWGLDFDRHGRLLASTNVGGYVLWHIVQGGYYWKKFSKHGPLRNPYTFGYFEHVSHESFRGGHVTVGGMVYQGHTFPAGFRDQYIGASLLSHEVHFHPLEVNRSTFRSRHGGELLIANDNWFAPTDLTIGPDGAVYVSDWHDVRTAHPNPDAKWDRSNGRIYRIQSKGAKPEPKFDLHKLSDSELLKFLDHRNEWFARAARRVLVSRNATSTYTDGDERTALNALWTLASTDGFNEAIAEKSLRHQSEHVRSWTIRLLGDRNQVSDRMVKELRRLAREDPSPVVRSQLASTAGRLSAKNALDLAETLLRRNVDVNDPHIPLLLWWAIERHAVDSIDEIEQRFVTADSWDHPFVRKAILGRLMKRFAAEGSTRSLTASTRLLETAPASDQSMLTALREGLAMSSEPSVPQELRRLLAKKWRERPMDPALLDLNGRLENPEVLAAARDVALSTKRNADERLRSLAMLARHGSRDICVPSLLKLLTPATTASIRHAAMDVLARFADPRIGARLLEAYPQYDTGSRTRARRVLFSRPAWTRRFLAQKNLAVGEIAVAELNALAALDDEQINQLVTRHWGTINTSTAEQKITEIRRVRYEVRGSNSKPGDPRRGREVFQLACGTCHRLFGEGSDFGPDLTEANRGDFEYLLESIIDPGRFVRKEFLNSVVETKDQRTLTGLIANRSPAQLKLRSGPTVPPTIIRQSDIREVRHSNVSLMPENLLQALTTQQLQDLFSHLQRKDPPREADDWKRPVYHARRATTPIVIDGKADEADWQEAEVIDRFDFPWWKGKQATEQSQVRMLWDDRFVYILHTCIDGHINSQPREHDDPQLARDDCFEIMVAPDPLRPNSYFNIEWNVNGAYIDAHRPAGPKGPRLAEWDAKGVIVRSIIRKDSWTCEVAIPLDVFAGNAEKPRAGRSWNVNFNRHNYLDAAGKLRQLSQWSSTGTPRPAFHVPGRFGSVVFVNSN
ncbi:MAG: dehydrogenase [Verrucomicrobiales bacterium]|nr:dehydrogenase [Verrucomicrobiales bacterium]